ncbi:MAG: TlpA disulfide reductase family protein [Alysiella sp.]|uniref:TlpA family protein disulfide reductase n=1 Tax=Alysiella sp. TaxID=1872483 RepID=UPI0026DAD1ED|nr:TlpA disulfide reductase family protein [Alysiella sp.]MDO4432988.1 TlpA disulfide reductase family protein [Alysiella sp.]
MRKFDVPFLALCLLFSPCVLANDFVSHHNEQTRHFNPQAKIHIINFWATWCAPCREEMPAMSHWHTQKGKKHRVQMVGIAIDKQENVAQFLKQTPVSYEIWRYTGSNSRAMMKTYGNPVGVLPYTLVRAPQCQQEQAITGKVDADKLDKAIANLTKQCPKLAA